MTIRWCHSLDGSPTLMSHGQSAKLDRSTRDMAPADFCRLIAKADASSASPFPALPRQTVFPSTPTSNPSYSREYPSSSWSITSSFQAAFPETFSLSPQTSHCLFSSVFWSYTPLPGDAVGLVSERHPLHLGGGLSEHQGRQTLVTAYAWKVQYLGKKFSFERK